MDWRALEDHFRVAATQEPGPFGDDAIEWDYSRYARGLGLTGEPGAHDLPHRGCAVAALPPGRWEAAEKKLRAWAEQRGYGLWRFSARPTVAVPDPVTYALGVRAAGEDSLLFARAAVPVRPAMGHRPRSEGMSFPLTSGERWLIATDRVRRRMRAEIAMRGLVLFVEEAEWITPGGLAVLMYLLDAHRAWRARMLCRPARVYVVLATAPEHEGSVVRMLERFRLQGHLPILRERRAGENGAAMPAPPALRDMEEEYLLGALAGAPAALAEEDVRGIFGASAVDRCRAMAERGVLRVRREAGQACYAPNPAFPAAVAAASVPRRAFLAVAAHYRRRARRGHEHLALAAAALELGLGRAQRAEAAVARMPYTAGAMLPLRLFEEIDAALQRANHRLRADHVAAWFSLAAHQRAYDRARELAYAVTERELRTWKEMLRVVQVVLCTGRTHMDTCLPPDFWPKLKSRQLAGPFMDATCVLAELFWRKRYLGNADIQQRYDFACDCFSRGEPERPQSTWFDRLDRITRLVIYRAALHLDVPSSILAHTSVLHADESRPTLRSFLRTCQAPAYIAAAPAFAEAAAGQIASPRSFLSTDRFFAINLGATTAQVADLAVTTATTIRHLVDRGLRMLLRDVVDELLLALPSRANPSDRHDLGRFLLPMTGGRSSLVGANAIYLAHGQPDVPGRGAFDEFAMAEALMRAGDLVGARDRIMTGIACEPRCSFVAATIATGHAVLARKSLDMKLLASTAALASRCSLMEGSCMRQYVEEFIAGSRALCYGHYELARRRFVAAHGRVRPTVEWARGLRDTAMSNAVYAQYAHRVVEAWRISGRAYPGIWKVMRVLCAGREWRTARPSLRGRSALCLDYLWGILDTWAHTQVDGEDVLRVVFFLKSAVDATFRPLGGDFVGLAAKWAPRLYERIRAAVLERVGDLGMGTPEARALNAALATIEQAWRDGHAAGIGDSCERIVVRANRSSARNARALKYAWYDDATTYGRVCAEDAAAGRGGVGTATLVAYGYVGRTTAKPVSTMLNSHVTSLGNGVREIRVDACAARSGAVPRRRRVGAHDAAALAFVGRSAAAQKVRSLIEAASRCDYAVLILGDTGVGKELVARCIHAASRWAGMAMVVAECASTVETLLESELFGHERGAFTGATSTYGGVFERAHGSSLLLDEVDSMSTRMQAALLRVLETKEYRRVGGTVARKSEFRLLSTAQPRLLALAGTGRFREDLLYRISTLRIEVPALRERGGDAEEIAVAHAATLGLQITKGARRVVCEYEWPGNVRQLRNCIQAASLHSSDGRIGEAAIGDVIATYRGYPSSAGAEAKEGTDGAWSKALRKLEGMKQFGAWDFANAAELSRRSAQRHIAQLLREGRIVRTGAGRGTRYRLHR